MVPTVDILLCGPVQLTCTAPFAVHLTGCDRASLPFCLAKPKAWCNCACEVDNSASYLTVLCSPIESVRLGGESPRVRNCEFVAVQS